MTSYGSRACLQAAAKAKRKANREEVSQPQGSSSPPAQRRRTSKMGSNLPIKQSPKGDRGRGLVGRDVPSEGLDSLGINLSGSVRKSPTKPLAVKVSGNVRKSPVKVSKRIISPVGVQRENSRPRVKKAGGAVKRGFSEIGEGRGNPPRGFDSPGGSRPQKKARRGQGNPEARVD